MKQTEFKSLINECVREVMAEEKANKKKAVLKKIQEIISENEISEADIEEAGIFSKIKQAVTGKGEPATAEEIDAYLAAKPKLKAHLEKTKTLDDWKAEAAKPENSEAVKNKQPFVINKGAGKSSFGGGLFEVNKLMK